MQHVAFRSIAISNHFGQAEGRLVLVDDALFAVLSRLDDEHYDENLRGRWFLEAGFGRIATNTPPTFANLDEATTWVHRELARVARTRKRGTSST